MVLFRCMCPEGRRPTRRLEKRENGCHPDSGGNQGNGSQKLAHGMGKKPTEVLSLQFGRALLIVHFSSNNFLTIEIDWMLEERFGHCRDLEVVSHLRHRSCGCHRLDHGLRAWRGLTCYRTLVSFV